MKRILIAGISTAGLGGGVLAIVTAAGLALATAGASSAQNTVIFACVSTGNGAMHVAQSASDCKSTETPISWNITGPA